MKTKTLFLATLIVAGTSLQAQITPSLSIPNPIPEYNGTYEDFGQHHFFYPNGGEIRYADENQTSASEVMFYTRFTYPRQYLLSNNDISFVFARIDTAASPQDSLHRIDLTMDRGSSSAFLARVDTQNTCVLNYFTQYFGPGGRTDVKGGASIAVQSIYQNIDMVYTSNNTGLKIFYVIYPGGDPNSIIWKLSGAKSTGINGAGRLEVNALFNNGISFGAPQMYQYTLVNNVITPYLVCSNPSWQSIGSDKYKFSNICAYDPNLPLIVQVSEGPATQPNINNITWSTHYGGGLVDFLYKSKSDASNNLYVCGQTLSADFPQANGPIQVVQDVKKTGNDGFLSKFDAAGVLKWRTFVGGNQSDRLNDFDFQGSDIYCVGFTTSWANLPTFSKTGAYNNNAFNGGSGDGFIFQTNGTGANNNWLTYFGGNKVDDFDACKFDANFNLFISGYSASSNISLVGTTSQYQQNYTSGGTYGLDGIILKLNANSSSINWFTYYGTNDDDQFLGIDVSGNDVYACGLSLGAAIPGALNSKVLTSFSDGILAGFSTSGALNAAKYTNGNIQNLDVKVFNGKVYTCGEAKSGMNTVNSGNYYFDGTCASSDFDAVFSVHSLNLATTHHATYIGGSAYDIALNMVFATNGVFYICGGTQSNDFPTTGIANTYNSSFVGNVDYFISVFNEGNSSMVWGTYLGSMDVETGFTRDAVAIAIDGNNHLHLCGTSDAYNGFPVDNGGGVPYFQPARSGGPFSGDGGDATITRFDVSPVNTFVGLNENKSNIVFGFYPNPVKSELAINNPELAGKKLHYAIYNTAGQKLSEGTTGIGRQEQIKVEDLAPGVYMIYVNNGHKTFCNKFVKIND